MSNKDKRGIGVLIIVFGIIILFFGIVLTFSEKIITQVLPFGDTIPTSYGYPYRPLGIVLVLVGIVLAILGSYLWKNATKVIDVKK